MASVTCAVTAGRNVVVFESPVILNTGYAFAIAAGFAVFALCLAITTEVVIKSRVGFASWCIVAVDIMCRANGDGAIPVDACDVTVGRLNGIFAIKCIVAVVIACATMKGIIVQIDIAAVEERRIGIIPSLSTTVACGIEMKHRL